MSFFLRIALLCVLFNSLYSNVWAQGLVVKEDIRHVKCEGDANGRVKLFVTGGHPPYQYKWNDGSVHDNLVNLKPGNYSCVIIDSKQNVTRKNFRIHGSQRLDVNHSVESNNGIAAISFNVRGGESPYKATFVRNDGSYGAFDLNGKNNLESGAYTIYVSDSRGCVKELIVDN